MKEGEPGQTGNRLVSTRRVRRPRHPSAAPVRGVAPGQPRGNTGGERGLRPHGGGFDVRRKATVSILIVLAVLLAGALLVPGITGRGQSAGEPSADPPAEESHDGDGEGKGPYPMVTIRMENGAEIKLELYPDVAPITVDNFLSLARSGFYDGTIFHRVIPGFVIQGGDPEGTGMGGPGYTIKGEFAANGVPNDLKHERGVISMARAQHPDSAGSQFFIVVADAPHLDGHYAAFGRVVSGMEEVDRIVAVPRNPMDRPLEPQRIATVTVADE